MCVSDPSDPDDEDPTVLHIKYNYPHPLPLNLGTTADQLINSKPLARIQRNLKYIRSLKVWKITVTLLLFVSFM
jgi:hypothetical protein